MDDRRDRRASRKKSRNRKRRSGAPDRRTYSDGKRSLHGGTPFRIKHCLSALQMNIMQVVTSARLDADIRGAAGGPSFRVEPAPSKDRWHRTPGDGAASSQAPAAKGAKAVHTAEAQASTRSKKQERRDREREAAAAGTRRRKDNARRAQVAGRVGGAEALTPRSLPRRSSGRSTSHA